MDLVTGKKTHMSQNEKDKMKRIIKTLTDYLVEHNPYIKLLRTRSELEADNVHVNPQPQFNVSPSYFNQHPLLS